MSDRVPLNKTTVKRMGRLYELMGAVPRPDIGGGGKTATAMGYISYDRDMRQLQPILQKVILGMLFQRHGDVDPYEYDDPDMLLDVAEEWVALRNSQQWEMVNKGYELEQILRNKRQVFFEKLEGETGNE